MGLNLKFTAINTALLFTLSSSVFAGDYYPPGQVDDAPEVTVVEFGTGWYLRGDIAYSDTVDPGFTQGGIANNQDLGNAYSFGVGAGYTVNNYLRVEGSIDHMINLGYTDESVINCGVWDHDVDPLTAAIPITGSCGQSSTVAVGATLFMANAYVDLGNFRGITPYVGGGIGGAYMNWEDYTYQNNCRMSSPVDCQNGTFVSTPTTITSHKEWKPAGSLMAGFAYDLTKNLKLDVGYKFTYISGGTVADDIPTATGFTDLDYNAFNIHQVKVGLRYEIW